MQKMVSSIKFDHSLNPSLWKGSFERARRAAAKPKIRLELAASSYRSGRVDRFTHSKPVGAAGRPYHGASKIQNPLAAEQR
jgi:hypothetical protein